MPKHIDQPCKDGLSAACFAQEPNFAKRAFSFRLLNAFVPPKLSRRLLTFLGLIRFDPAGNMPDWLNLPPWWIILPGAIIPPGWKFGDPVPDGVYQLPNFFQRRGWQYPIGPDYLKPGGSGSPGKSKTSPNLFEPWFYDDFTTWDPSYWEIWEEPGTSVTPSTGQVRFQSPGAPDYCGIRSLNNDDTCPVRFIMTFNIAFMGWGAGNDYLHIKLNTGIRAPKISFYPPNTIANWAPLMTDLTVDNLTSTFETWKIVFDEGTCSLYREGVLLSEGIGTQWYSGYPGTLNIWNNYELHTVIKLLSVVEY